MLYNHKLLMIFHGYGKLLDNLKKNILEFFNTAELGYIHFGKRW